ncbi:hydroxyethylthiazole kinase [Humibacter ginsenosidimutans]|uniref:Hydroxyethylthiazole kinase n=1 Tax=Humibacter ginsenosidimutans TaxID=2599293 RepID=A0A5B8M8Y5_9MICO|nr:hydroxyethylthiazole kinase [Humibacter ginsenosidimutans]QDZ16524.1 hydroxyethylthiazole kinase [Humibacter ginsenosidimutans]
MSARTPQIDSPTIDHSATGGRTAGGEGAPAREGTAHDLVAESAALLDRVRASAPLVQAITNTVVTGFTANVLLALGAAPAMVDIPGEASPFATIAGGLLINLGTPHAEPRDAMREAARAASACGTPWVLDPVAVGSLPVRTALAAELLDLRPTVIRGNASEIIAVAGRGRGGRGVDATDDPESALDAARELAHDHGSIVAVSGAVDVITDGERVVRAGNGHPLLTKVTGGGCALGAVMAAFAATSADRFATTVAAVTVYNIAAEHAERQAWGPGTFAANLLDSLAAITPEHVISEARLS